MESQFLSNRSYNDCYTEAIKKVIELEPAIFLDTTLEKDYLKRFFSKIIKKSRQVFVAAARWDQVLENPVVLQQIQRTVEDSCRMLHCWRGRIEIPCGIVFGGFCCFLLKVKVVGGNSYRNQVECHLKVNYTADLR